MSSSRDKITVQISLIVTDETYVSQVSHLNQKISLVNNFSTLSTVIQKIKSSAVIKIDFVFVRFFQTRCNKNCDTFPSIFPRYSILIFYTLYVYIYIYTT